MIKATITVNRKILAQNRKKTIEQGILVDNPAISIRTYLGVIYAKEVKGNATLIQDASSARCNGATVWMEAYLENLVIDGVPGSREMFSKDSHGSITE